MPAGCVVGCTLLARSSVVNAVCGGKRNDRPERRRLVVDRNGTLGGGTGVVGGDTLGGVVGTLGGVTEEGRRDSFWDEVGGLDCGI